eukprot:CAMPEP_0119334910 /NCGR_PEP_ID=MMETSP1333-20130426/88295_1 /TAXON_ID=418940 /ORGANISM="Scyphosphaera apsteinii, Strain RCC1455" /LENGTH=460 /DNA_ID=CAMNT_0007345333 /DNA_START=54 /DNA_END=1436 /DNA_ORIENTATION=+
MPVVELRDPERPRNSRVGLLNETGNCRGNDDCRIGTKIVFFLCGAGGGGHKASANAIRDCLVQEGVEWAAGIKLLNPSVMVDEMLFGSAAAQQREHLFDGDAWYNWFMKRGYYRFAGISGFVALAAVWLRRTRIERGFENWLREVKPDLVVSFVPYLNSTLRVALRRACPGRRLVTVVTDMSSTYAHRWIDSWHPIEGKHHIIVAGSDELQQQARRAGYPDRNLLCTSGMVVNPAFYCHAPHSCSESVDTASSAGSLRRDRRTGSLTRDVAAAHTSSTKTAVASNGAATQLNAVRAIIFFGGFAPMRTVQIVRQLRRSHPQMNLVVLCGGNERLEIVLREELAGPYCLVEGMVTAERVRQHLETATFVIGKPGPGVVAEASVCGKPFVTERKVMPQERSVLRWLESTGAGVIVRSLERLPPDLLEHVEASRLALVERGLNNAVFEVSQLIRSLVEEPERV